MSNPKAVLPPRITFFSKPGCPHCARAREMLNKKGDRFEEIELGSNGISYSSLLAVSGQGTTPQVFIDGRHIGGADELGGLAGEVDMTPIHVDVAIIGSGTAGMGAYLSARAHTDSILLIGGGNYGTTCARVGCMPSKLLIAAAEVAHQARHADRFGILATDMVVDGPAVMARVRRERDRFVGFVLASVDAMPRGDRWTARVSFQDANTLVTPQGHLIHARRIVIATGSKPVLPPLLQELDAHLLTSENIFELPTLPKSLAVFGTGPLGIELGQAMSRLGVEVMMFGLGGGIAGIRDPEMRDYANEFFTDEFYLDADADLESVSKAEAGVVLCYRHKAGNRIAKEFDYVLAATGRAPDQGERTRTSSPDVKMPM